MMKRTGRPSLDPRDVTVEMALSLPARQYDALTTRARAERVTVPELIRRMITPNRLFLGKVPSRDSSR